MKKSDKTALTAAIFAAALNIVPIAANAESNNNEPSDIPTEYYSPEDEDIQDVYGPPEYFTTETTQTTSAMDTNYYDIINTTTEPVYGPPWMFTTTTTETTPVPVYGPPPITGDIDYNGVVDVFDLIAARKILASNGADNSWGYSADINHDTRFTIADVVSLSRILLNRGDYFVSDSDLTDDTPQPEYGAPIYFDDQE